MLDLGTVSPKDDVYHLTPRIELPLPTLLADLHPPASADDHLTLLDHHRLAGFPFGTMTSSMLAGSSGMVVTVSSTWWCS